MKVRRNSKKHLNALANENITLPKDFPWKVFGALLKDLRCYNVEVDADCEDFSSESWALLASKILRSRSAKSIGTLGSLLGPPSMLPKLVGEKKEALSFFTQYQVGSFLKKYPFNGVAARTNAIRTFVKFEAQCSRFNKENYKALQRLNECHAAYCGVVEEIREDILHLLGESPNVNGVFYHAKHGPGSAAGGLYRDGRVTSFFKWSELPYSVTPNCVPYAKAVIESDPRWIGALDEWYRRKTENFYRPIDVNHFWSEVLRLTDHSQITTVPKSVDTDRTIAIEPVLNVFLQLGVDQVIRRRLLARWNYNLNDQSVNQNLAKEASCSNRYATIDLSGASDTISLKICEMLLPPAWYNLLLDLRTPKGDLDGTVARFDKISSMGNGFTFALESLIFGALARCAMRRSGQIGESAVYGDDIIIPVGAVPFLFSLLDLCGFTINKEKSFVDGPFKESCGCDSYLGYDVRPVFLKHEIKTVSDLFYLHNVFVEKEQSLEWSWCVEFEQTKKLIRKYIPKAIRNVFYGPPSESLDTYLFSSRKLSTNSHGQKIGFRIIPVPTCYRQRYVDFYFIKLMASLKQMTIDRNWSRRTLANSGNAFDIVKRDRTALRAVQVVVWD